MKNISLTCLVSLLLTSCLYGFYDRYASLKTSSTLVPGQLIVGIEHRFLGPINENPGDTLLGTSTGASVKTSTRIALMDGMDIEGSLSSQQKEYYLGMNYNLPLIEFATTQLSLFYNTFKLSSISERKHHALSIFSLQTKYPLSIGNIPIHTALNIISGTYEHGPSVSIGCDATLLEDFHVLSTYWIARDASLTHTYSIGILYQTFGHNFFLNIQNNPVTGLRLISKGSESDKWYLGFGIERILEW